MDFLPEPDEELFPNADPEPDWQIYEKAIAHVEESYQNCKVTKNYKPKGRRSGVTRQVDVWLEAKIGDQHAVTIAIECRRYNKAPVSIKDIDAFVGFLDDVGANKGVVISHSGYTKGAKGRASGAGIELKTLTVAEAEQFDWEEFIEADSCQAPECFGTISWRSSDGDSEAGHCDHCGSFHIRCGKCGSLDWYHESQIESCSGCDMKWRLLQETVIPMGSRRCVR